MQINKFLAGLLAAQLLFGAAVWWPHSEAEQKAVALVDASSDAITTLEITGAPAADKPAEPVRLQKQGAGWVLSSANNYPADPAKVKDVLDKITGMKLKETVSVRKTSQDALSVSDTHYTRKVTVAAGGQTTTFYLGAGQANSMNVRRDGTDEVYVIHGTNAWSIPDTGSRYFDTSYIKADATKLAQVTVKNAKGTLVLKHDASGWVDAGNPGLPLDQKQVGNAIRRLTDLRISKPVSDQVDPKFGLDGSTRVEWTTTGDDGNVATSAYDVGSEADNLRYVKADDKSWVVQIASSSVAQVLTLTAADLLSKPAPAAE
jgi:hypothetical protein